MMSKKTREPARMQDFRKLPGHLIRRLHQASVALFAEECAALDITPVQYAALFAIGETPQIDATRLSGQIFFDRSTLGSVLDRLEKKKLVHRRSSRNDRRTKVLMLTPEGEHVLRLAAPAVLRVQQRLMSPLSAGDRKRMQRLLEQLAYHHQVRELGMSGND
jgi:MarR family transcriptional regulator, lower aerobic nicotinate degradation pathway regulator